MKSNGNWHDTHVISVIVHWPPLLTYFRNSHKTLVPPIPLWPYITSAIWRRHNDFSQWQAAFNWSCSLLAISPATASYRNSNTRPSDNKVDIISSLGFQGSNNIMCIDNFVGNLNWYICFYIAPEGLVLAGWIEAVVNWTPLASNTLCLCSPINISDATEQVLL